MTDSDWGLKLLKSSQTKKAKFHAMNAMARKIKFEILVYRRQRSAQFRAPSCVYTLCVQLSPGIGLFIDIYTMIFFAIFYFIKKIWSHSF